MPRYFLDLPEDDAPRTWDPGSGPRAERADTRYFGGVLRHMEAALEDGDLDVYLTWDVHRLPAYGPRVVAVVLGDEAARVPAYLDRVRAVFKCYGARPSLGDGPHGSHRGAPAGDVGQWLRHWARGAPERLRARRLDAAPIAIPLGTYNQLELPAVPFEERRTDLFFAGSVGHEGPLGNRPWMPKVRARREMLSALDALGARRPELRLDVRLTAGFEDSRRRSAAEYSEGLMDSRVCLAPRGTSLETFRVFEGLRCGCLVVVERLPPHWFYAGAPVLRVDRWRRLSEALAPFAQPEVRLRWHEAALEWWQTRCSEAAVGRFVADRLNALTAGEGPPPRRWPPT